MRNILFLLIFLISIQAHASADRELHADTINATGGAAIAVPSTGANFVSDTATQTLTNKTLTAPAITSPTGITKSDVGLSNVDNTSDATKNAASVTLTNKTLTSPVINSPTGIVKGDVGLGNVDNTSDATKNAATATLTNKTLTSPVINSPTGIVKGDVGLGNVDNTSDATKNAAAVTLTNKTIDYNSNTILNLPSAAPSLNGGSASPQTVTAAGGVSLSSISFGNFAWVVSNSGSVTVTATPSVTAGTSDGQILHIAGTSDTDKITLQDQANLASSGLSLNGNWMGAKDSVLTMHWDAAQSLWIEDSRR